MMKVIVMITRNPAQCYLLDILKQRHVNRVRRLVGGGKYSDAIIAALSGCVVVEEVAQGEMPEKSADLVITEHSAHWDLCAGK
jgi:hypothetical protein